jgi:S-adenosyl methyltransferase
VSNDDTAPPRGDAEENLAAKIDTTIPVSARIWNYWLGGKDYYPVDKEAGDQFAEFYPGIFTEARASRYFIARVVRYLAGEAGIRQFLDIGTGLPSHDNTHEIAQQVAPGSRIVYADNDPLVLAHARALLTSSGEGSTDYIDADLYDPDALLRVAREKLDFSRPVAIMLMGILGHIGNPEQDDDRVAQSIVATLKAALPAGGYLAIYDSSDVDPGLNDALRKYNETGAVPYLVRRPDQIARFFDGLELVDPGVVPITRWRADHTQPGPPRDLTNLGGVARKALCRSTNLQTGLRGHRCRGVARSTPNASSPRMRRRRGSHRAYRPITRFPPQNSPPSRQRSWKLFSWRKKSLLRARGSSKIFYEMWLLGEIMVSAQLGREPESGSRGRTTTAKVQ